MLPLNKTAPRLLHSIYNYNAGSKSIEPNALQIEDHCHHDYATKQYQSRLPVANEEQGPGCEWRVAATCQLCLARLDVRIKRNTGDRPCPSNQYPLHIFTEAQQRGIDHDDEHLFKCISPECGASLSVIFKTSVLDSADLHILLSQAKIVDRRDEDKSRSTDGKRSSFLRNLRTFRTYIIDAIRADEQKRILATNPRFVEVFGSGPAADDLLEKIGFRLDELSDSKAWIPPRPQSFEEREQLLDLSEELTIRLRKSNKVEQATGTGPSFESPPTACLRDLEFLLGSTQYERYTPPRYALKSINQSEQDLPYAHLGIMPDFSDSLVLWAYRCLISVENPKKHPLLFQSLKDIAAMRNSETISLEIGTLESQGVQASGEIENAFRILGIDPNHAEIINDLSILGAYKSRFVDVGADEQDRMRAALKVIAEHRISDRLLQEAHGTLETYQQALDWLGAPDHNTDDEFVISLMAIKIEESPNNEPIARRAVEIIATARNSNRLKTHLIGHEVSESYVTLSDAYEMLGCPNNHEIDDALLIDSYRIAISDNPACKDRLKRALSVIADDRDRRTLKDFLRSEDVSIAPDIYKPNQHDPRGLKNIGNTCYLNSLLQYLFTIKPLRDVVSNFQMHCQHISPDTPILKKVSHVEVRAGAIIRAQNFVEELNKLFIQLVTARENFVTPEDNLARLTLVNVVDEGVRRRSTIRGSKQPPAMEPNSQNILQKLDPMIEADKAVPIDANAPAVEADESAANRSNHGDASRTSPGPTTWEHSQEAVATSASFDTLATTADSVSSVPSTPNPVPYFQRAEYEEFARQQDVREVIQNVLGQLRWAIQSEAEEADGEQIDLISRLFYGKENYVTVNETGEESKIQPFFDIWVYFAAGSCDIYTALDGTFDRDIIEGLHDGSTKAFQYRTITVIPPILQISVSRVNFDMQTSRTFKIEDQLRLQEMICMDRYFADPKMLEKRRQSWLLKAELQKLQNRREKLTKALPPLSLPDVIEHTCNHLRDLKESAHDLGLENLNISQDVFHILDVNVQEIRNELKDLNAKIEVLEKSIADIFNATGELMYRLHGVFVHRGNSRAGHWFIYLYDSENKVWRNYNDETVTPVLDTSSIFEPEASRDGTSSFVVYVRDSLLNNIVETAHRRPREFEPPKAILPYKGFKAPYS